MRITLLLGLLLVAACTTGAASDGLSYVPPNLDNPTGGDDDHACPGPLGHGSRLDEYRDGTASFFCD